ncbi:CPBP family intramembrane glutamic endopeptidase [Pararhodobacter sp.]|uniref:CPBP family intramembrane glutamic endopeptidase n=1 Tax=Pararhodobacter sp. TaxID=2127056 RepID=UPI002AFEF3F1|nr:CPBP family intramembrane glutamic endopeptidase [Pararhodobacter sp.]
MTRDPLSDKAADAPPSAWAGSRGRRNAVLSIKGALVMLALWVLVSGSGFAARFLEMPAALAFLEQSSIPQTLAVAGLTVAILFFGWRDTGLGAAKPGTASVMWFPSLYLLAFAGIMLAFGAPSFDVLLSLTYSMIWISISEEIMFRGLLFPALRRQMPLWPAIGLTSALFGAVHLLNALGDGDLVGAIIQTIAATMTGFLLLALRLRRGSLWPAILYHMAWNVGVFGIGIAVQTDAEYTAETVREVVTHNPLTVVLLFALVLPNALYALWLLRHARRQDLPGDVAHTAPRG